MAPYIKSIKWCKIASYYFHLQYLIGMIALTLKNMRGERKNEKIRTYKEGWSVNQVWGTGCWNDNRFFTGRNHRSFENGEHVSLHGFGKFSARKYGVRKCYNPVTKELITLNPSIQPAFNAEANKGLDKYKIVKEGKVLTITITKADGGTSHTFKYDTTADTQTVYGENTAPSKGGVVFGFGFGHL